MLFWFIVCKRAEDPSAYPIIGLEFFVMDQNLSRMGAWHLPWAHYL